MYAVRSTGQQVPTAGVQARTQLQERHASDTVLTLCGIMRGRAFARSTDAIELCRHQRMHPAGRVHACLRTASVNFASSVPQAAAASPTSIVCSSVRKSQKPSIMSTASLVPAIIRSRVDSSCSRDDSRCRGNAFRWLVGDASASGRAGRQAGKQAGGQGAAACSRHAGLLPSLAGRPTECTNAPAQPMSG